MARANRLKEIESHFNEPLDKIIITLVNIGGQKHAAETLGVSPATISFWLKRNNYIPKTIYVRKKENQR